MLLIAVQSVIVIEWGLLEIFISLLDGTIEILVVQIGAKILQVLSEQLCNASYSCTECDPMGL